MTLLTRIRTLYCYFFTSTGGCQSSKTIGQFCLRAVTIKLIG